MLNLWWSWKVWTLILSSSTTPCKKLCLKL
jgi:hypothetical protein